MLCLIKCSCQCFSVSQKLCDFKSLFKTWGFLLLHMYTPIQHLILHIFTLQWCHTTRLLSLLHYIYLTAIITSFEMQCKHMISFSNMIICLSVSAGLLCVMEEIFKLLLFPVFLSGFCFVCIFFSEEHKFIPSLRGSCGAWCTGFNSPLTFDALTFTFTTKQH